MNVAVPTACVVCAEPASKHYGKLSAHVVSSWGLRTQSVLLCERHMALVINALLSFAQDLQLPPTLELHSWVKQEEMGLCDLCGRQFYVPTEPNAVVESIHPEWQPIVACGRCNVPPFPKLVNQVRTAASIHDQLRFNRSDVLRLLKSHGKDSWL